MSEKDNLYTSIRRFLEDHSIYELLEITNSAIKNYEEDSKNKLNKYEKILLIHYILLDISLCGADSPKGVLEGKVSKVKELCRELGFHKLEKRCKEFLDNLYRIEEPHTYFNKPFPEGYLEMSVIFDEYNNTIRNKSKEFINISNRYIEHIDDIFTDIY